MKTVPPTACTALGSDLDVRLEVAVDPTNLSFDNSTCPGQSITDNFPHGFWVQVEVSGAAFWAFVCDLNNDRGCVWAAMATWVVRERSLAGDLEARATTIASVECITSSCRRVTEWEGYLGEIFISASI